MTMHIPLGFEGRKKAVLQNQTKSTNGSYWRLNHTHGGNLWNCCIKLQVKKQQENENNTFCLRLFLPVSKVREAAPSTIIQAKKIINTILREILFCLFNWEACYLGHFLSWHLEDTHTQQNLKKKMYVR